ncbi:MAG: hypothetical protein ACKOPE_13880 [Novosphingobium sp.]
MSMMCKMSNQCCATKGMCVHEKMMMGAVMLMALAAAGHFWLHLF